MIFIKTYNRREIQKILRKNGWLLERHTGGHAIYKKGTETLTIGLTKCNKMILQRLIKQYNILL